MSNIGKRFAKPAEWEQPHFTELDLKQRLFWLFLNNRCDLAGVYQLHFPVDSAYLGFTIDQQFIDSFIEAINSDSKRLEQLKGRRLWLLNFIRYQQVGQKNRPLSSKAPPHISIVNKLKEHGLLATAVERDSELFKEFTGEVPESPSDSSNYPKTTLSVDKPNPYSSSNSKSDSSITGKSDSPNKSDSHIQSNGIATNSEEDYYEELKDNIGGIAILNISSLGFPKDVDTMLEEFEASEIEDPKSYLLKQTKEYDWTGSSWNEFVTHILNREDVPF